jgi:GTPase Era involved in 16S rRNA processing
MSFKTWRERSKCSNIILSKLIECDIHPKIIIGRGGENIRAIQYDTNTHIKILRDENTILIT